MLQGSQDLCNALAKCVVDRDFEGAHALLAPWLQSTMKAGDIQRMVDAAGEGLAPAQSWTVDEGLLEVDDLRTPDPYGPPTTAVSPEITTENYRGWLCIQFQPDPALQEEQNVCYDLWLAAVEQGGAFKVGYLEAAEAS